MDKRLLSTCIEKGAKAYVSKPLRVGDPRWLAGKVGGWERFSGRNSRLDVSKVSEVVMKRTSIDLHIPHGISSIKSLSAPTVYKQCPRDTNICFKY